MRRPYSSTRRRPSTRALVRQLARPYRGWLAVILGAMGLEALTGLASPWPLKIVIDDAIGDRALPDWAAGLVAPLGSNATTVAVAAGIVIVAIAGIGAVASYVDNYYTESVGQSVANDLRLRIFQHLESLSFTYYDTHQTGTLLSTMTDDVSTVQDFISSSALTILVDVMTIGGMLVLMFWLNWTITLLVVAITPVILLAVSRTRDTVKQATREVRRRESDMVAVAKVGIELVRTVQALGGQEMEEARLAEASHAKVVAALRARRLKSVVPPLVSLVVALCTATVLWRGTALVVADGMTIGTLTVFLAYLSHFFKPVQDLAKMTNAVTQAHVALERITAILDLETTVRERTDAREPPPLKGAIAFEQVSFSYFASTEILRSLTLSIPPGAFVGIVGPTGSGKSTIAALIARFYDPSNGRVLVDGMDVRDVTLQGLRRQIAFVLQDTVLFGGTIRENIAYGRHDATDAEIVEAAKLANAHEFISRMPGGYEARIGERGVTLSGGQRQRIGIARAFIRNTPILILDEPTASLDPESERLVMEGLRRLMEGRTVIMITHRLNTVRNAHSIVVVHNGGVVEQGTHDELLACGGIYAAMYRTSPGSAEMLTGDPLAGAGFEWRGR
jgi:ABC-type multidrug transport system fused ATPase/permease subunit